MLQRLICWQQGNALSEAHSQSTGGLDEYLADEALVEAAHARSGAERRLSVIYILEVLRADDTPCMRGGKSVAIAGAPTFALGPSSFQSFSKHSTSLSRASGRQISWWHESGGSTSWLQLSWLVPS
jgi:hypothetical protein